MATSVFPEAKQKQHHRRANPKSQQFELQPPSVVRRRAEQFVALICLVIASAPMLVIAMAVYLTSSGPILYRQTRSGLGGKPFTILKFRSMVHNAERMTGAVWSMAGDSRTTLIGRFLRRMHLDELPQLWNIVRGEMAFVGPRPERPEIIDKLELEIPTYYDRLAVLPGITGLAQVNLGPDVSIESVKRKFELDIAYILSRATLFVDLRIAAATALKMCWVPKEFAATACGVRCVPKEPISNDENDVDEEELVKQWASV